MKPNNMETLKLCKDCVFLNEKNKCVKQYKLKIDYVNGDTFYSPQLWRDNPHLQRNDGFVVSYLLDTCGKRGRFFKPKTETKP